MQVLFLSHVLFLVLQQCVLAQSRTIHEKHIFFHFYDEVGEEFQSHTVAQEEQFLESVRNNKENLAIIVHGWREGCSVNWAKTLIRNLNEFRGGTIICMDYSYFSLEESYFKLVRHFDPIAEVLKTKLVQLERVGYDPENVYMFGFSFGGQLVVEAGKRFGVRRIKEIDACDMAGPGFDNKPTSDHRLAAQNVQCIHTSRDKGTRFSICHQNWKMGNCGQSQLAASRPPYGSHGLCPYFYNAAFRHPFYAVPKPQQCRSKIAAPRWPKQFQMGYVEDRKGDVQGELFSLTSKSYPFNGDMTDSSYVHNEIINRRMLNHTLEDKESDFAMTWDEDY